MRIPALLACALSLAPTFAAAAEPHGVAAAFGNTVRAIYPDGRSQWLWFRADGAWEAFGRRGKWSSGKWSQKTADEVCLKQTKPIPVPVKYCTRFPADGAVGATWTSRSLEGDPIRLTVVPGIRKPPAP